MEHAETFCCFFKVLKIHSNSLCTLSNSGSYELCSVLMFNSRLTLTFSNIQLLYTVMEVVSALMFWFEQKSSFEINLLNISANWRLLCFTGSFLLSELFYFWRVLSQCTSHQEKLQCLLLWRVLNGVCGWDVQVSSGDHVRSWIKQKCI